MDHSFADQEKRFILAEMLKASPIEITAVVDFIKSRHIIPNWMEMELPRGRTMNQCMQAVAHMGIEAPPLALSQHHSQFRQYGSQQPLQQQVQHQHQPPPPPPPPQQQHVQHLQQHQQLPQGPPFSLPKPHPLLAKRRPSTDAGEPLPKRLAAASAEAMHPVSQPRTIQPRPMHGTMPSSPSHVATAPPAVTYKKRGRPSRADKDAKARAAGNHPLAYIAPASKVALPGDGPRPVYQPTSAQGTPDGHVSSHVDPWEHQGQPRQSADRSPQPGGIQLSTPNKEHADCLKPEPAPVEQPSTHEPPAEPVPTPEASPPIATNPQPSSRLAVADLLKSTGPAVITTGV